MKSGSKSTSSDEENQLQFNNHDLSDSDILQSLAQKLCIKIWPSANPDRTLIQNIGAGNYNEVLGITINGDGKSRTYRDTDLLKELIYPPIHIDEEVTKRAMNRFVLRIPRQSGSIAKSVAILKYLGKNADFKVPEIIHYDITKNNPMQLKYILMSWVEGKPLSDILKANKLDQDQRRRLATELSLFYKQIQGLNNNTPGEIFAGPIGNAGIDSISLQPIGTDPNNQDQSLVQRDNSKSTRPTNANMLVDAYTRKLKEANSNKESPLHSFIPQLETCLDIAVGLSKSSLLGDDSNFCLCHTDFFPRNIMLDTSKTPMITAIIDWDEPIFAPKFATCLPPVWLWQDLNRQKDEVEKFGTWSAADSVEHREVKRVFDETMGSEYVRLAYSPQYVIARRLLKFARDPTWQWRDWYIDQIDEIKQEWEKILELLPTSKKQS